MTAHMGDVAVMDGDLATRVPLPSRRPTPRRWLAMAYGLATPFLGAWAVGVAEDYYRGQGVGARGNFSDVMNLTIESVTTGWFAVGCVGAFLIMRGVGRLYALVFLCFGAPILYVFGLGFGAPILDPIHDPSGAFGGPALIIAKAAVGMVCAAFLYGIDIQSELHEFDAERRRRARAEAFAS